ncbi:OLC1v1024182C1 [Oldenlandia corymbosa var. corymbosa]|uniref:OLC1v1024182C1 n=1 Tax=Oldenlandia corymbosa var. corymbosa TaxID=529605 RepID=A0AAV1C2G4_OLDCO|nr:OLC1v1024182C1 [Oldenlandia corymbosa var. corymbosa]
MPLSSWKKKVKKNNNNISQFFRDQIQSSQRVVVETGFPTILVDLIVKNRRRRLKRSSEIEVQGGGKLNSSVPESSLPTPSPLELQQRPSPPPTLLNDMVEEKVDREIRDGENCKGLLMALLMGAFLVVLALGAKKFAVGLTLSAFVLIFVESLRKRCCFGVFIPCSVSRFMGIKEAKLEEERKCESSNSRRIITPNHKDSVVETKSVKIKSLLLDSNDESGSDGNLKRRKPDSLAVLLEEAYDSESKKKKKSGKAKMKSTLKHVFAKKSSKKGKKAGISGSNPTLTEENDAVNNLEHRDGNSSSISSGSHEAEEAIETLISVSDSDTDNLVMAVAEGESQRSGNFGYLFLCIIVLIGLYGGRIFALLLILTFCLVKKSGGKLRRYAGFCL